MKILKSSAFRRLLILALGCMAVGAASSAIAATTIIPWSAAAGAPKTPIGAKVAFYVWHVGNTVHLSTTGTTTAGHKDYGTFELTGGTISGLTRVQLERDDTTELVGKTKVIFHFDTAKGIDGLHFVVTKGTKLKLTVSFDGQAFPDLILYGKNATPVKNDPVTFDLTK